MPNYAKINESGSLEFAPRNKGSVSNWINNTEKVLEEGYLPVQEIDVAEGQVVVGYQVLDGYITPIIENIPEKEPESKLTEEEKAQTRIWTLKAQLAVTDYVVIKIAEGVATAEEYADILAIRKEWRTEINKLEATLLDIPQQENFPDVKMLTLDKWKKSNSSDNTPSETIDSEEVI